MQVHPMDSELKQTTCQDSQVEENFHNITGMWVNKNSVLGMYNDQLLTIKLLHPL